MRVEEGFVLEFQHGEVDPGRDEFDGGGEFVAGLVGLHLHLTRVEGEVGVGEDALALDDDAGPGGFARSLLGPRLAEIGVAHGRENFHDGVFDAAVGGGSRGGGRGRRLIFGRGERVKGSECEAEDEQRAGEAQGVFHAEKDKRGGAAREGQFVFKNTAGVVRDQRSR